MERIFFSLSPRSDELEAIRIARPDHILVSYALWSKKDLKSDLIDIIGYRPKQILLDSGAVTFRGQDVGLVTILENYIEHYAEYAEVQEEFYDMAARAIMYDMYALDRCEMDEDGDETFWALPILHEFVRFIHTNRTYISAVINLDTIGNSYLSEVAFKLLKAIGVNPVPVYGYTDEVSALDHYVAAGATFIALGGSKDEPIAKQRILWANEAASRYPQVRFHMLGTLNPHIIKALKENIVQVDGTCWNATRKKRRYGGNSKVQQSIQNIREKEKLAVSPTPPLSVASTTLPADVAALTHEQGASLMRSIVPHLVLGRAITIDFSSTRLVTPAYVVGLLEHLSESEMRRIRFAGLDGKNRSVMFAVGQTIVGGSREFGKFFMFYEANGKKFPVLLQESGIVTVLQGSTWSEWVDHGHYTLTDTKGYSETAAALYKQDTERRAENSQCSPLICNCGKTFSTLVGYRKHLSKCRNILRRERA